MRKLIAVAAGLVFALAAYGQDKGKEAVELPVKLSIARPAADKVDLAKTGIEWKKGLDAALNRGKPVLLFQLLGNLDDVYC